MKRGPDIGQRNGMLTVIGNSISKLINNRFRLFITVKCDCGVIKEISKDSFKGNQARSCGCSKGLYIKQANKEYYLSKRLYEGESSYNLILKTYKNRANSKNLEFTLTPEDFKKLTKQNCYWCGIEPKQRAKTRRGFGSYVYNGIDRLNNKLGYTIENSVACCGLCNRIKFILSKDEFISQIIKIYDNIKSRG